MRRQRGVYLQLLRFPNLFTAFADSLAGALYVGATLEDGWAIVLLGGASVCLYGGGVTLNDVCDVSVDARQRPQRPIPSGSVSRQAALCIACLLLIAGVGLAFSASARSGIIGSTVVVSIVFYNHIAKDTRAAPAVMGLCRALNLALGMSVRAVDLRLWYVGPMLLLWIYVASITVFARREAEQSQRLALRVATLGMCTAILGLLLLPLLLGSTDAAYVAAVMIFALAIHYRGLRASSTTQSDDVQRAVQMFVIALIVFDALLVVAARGWFMSLMVFWLLVPTILLGRAVRMT